jgi:hypothetical protein
MLKKSFSVSYDHCFIALDVSAKSIKRLSFNLIFINFTGHIMVKPFVVQLEENPDVEDDMRKRATFLIFFYKYLLA